VYLERKIPYKVQAIEIFAKSSKDGRIKERNGNWEDR